MKTTLLRTLCLSFAIVLSGCTAFYQRQFAVAADHPLSIEERDTIAQQYEDFMAANGYTPEPHTNERGRVVYFRIRDAQSRLFPTSRVRDSLSMHVDAEGNLVVALTRLSSYPPDDFSAQYVDAFVQLTTKYLQETTGKALVLQEIKK